MSIVEQTGFSLRPRRLTDLFAAVFLLTKFGRDRLLHRLAVADRMTDSDA